MRSSNWSRHCVEAVTDPHQARRARRTGWHDICLDWYVTASGHIPVSSALVWPRTHPHLTHSGGLGYHLTLMSVAVGLLVLLSASPVGFSTGATTVPTNHTANLTSFEWQAIASPQYAGESIGVVILAKDENGNSYPFNGTALLSTTRGDTFVIPNYVTFSNGVCATSIIVTIAESLALRCSKEAASGTSNVFEVLAGPANRLKVILPGEQLAPGVPGGHHGRPDDQTAGDTFLFPGVPD